MGGAGSHEDSRGEASRGCFAHPTGDRLTCFTRVGWSSSSSSLLLMLLLLLMLIASLVYLRCTVQESLVFSLIRPPSKTKSRALAHVRIAFLGLQRPFEAVQLLGRIGQTWGGATTRRGNRRPLSRPTRGRKTSSPSNKTLIVRLRRPPGSGLEHRWVKFCCALATMLHELWNCCVFVGKVGMNLYIVKAYWRSPGVQSERCCFSVFDWTAYWKQPTAVRIDSPFVPPNRTTISPIYIPCHHSTNQTPFRQRQLIPQVGTIQRQIGQVDEAVSSFNDALSLDPESILALEGSGEAYLAQAHARTSEGLYTAAAKALRNGRDATKRLLDLAKGKNNIGFLLTNSESYMNFIVYISGQRE